MKKEWVGVRLSREFHLRKQEQVKEVLAREGLDALVMVNPLNSHGSGD